MISFMIVLFETKFAVTATTNPVVPTKYISLTAEPIINMDYMQKEWEWTSQLKILINKETLDSNDNASWAAYGASTQPKKKTFHQK